MSHPRITEAVTSFFDRLNRAGIQYAVLRKAELIPHALGNDIDILIDKNERERVSGVINDCAKTFKFSVYKRKNVSGLYSILYAFDESRLIFFRLDFTNPAKNPEVLLQERIQNEKGIYYLPDGLYEKKPKSKIKNILSFPVRFLFPQGTFAVIVGPDGVGKSTASELSAELLRAFHVPVEHMHLGFRPRILPTKNSLKSFGKNKSAGSEESKVPGFFRFLYHTLDHFLGYWFVVRPGLIRGKTVLGERYYYSHLVDPRPQKRYGVPHLVFTLAFFFMPKPDIVILLSNKPEDIHKRRQEHSIEEISRQLLKYRELGMKARAFLEVKTDVPADEVALTIVNALAPKKHKVAVVASHPIQYQSPLWREIAKDPEIDLMVYYCVNWGVSKPQYDPKFFGKPYQWDIPLLESYKYKFLRNYSLKPGPYLGGFINPGIFWSLFKKNYDAVMILGWMDVTFWFAFLAAKITGTPTLLRVVNSSRYDQRVKRSISLLFIKRLYLKLLFHGFVSGFLAIGTWNKEMYLEFKVPPKRIFNFPYAVWNEFFLSETEKNQALKDQIRKEGGVSKDSIVITYAARFVEEKHPEHVIEAYNKLTKRLATKSSSPEVYLLMIGDGSMRENLEQSSKNKGLKNVIFTGFKNQTELVRLYAITDIFVRTDAPIKGDWGATVNEAMACGLPIVAPDTIGAQADLVRQGENGYVYPFGDTEVLAEYLEKIVSNPNLLESMKNKSKEIISKWSYKEDLEGLKEALRSLKT